MKKVYTLLVSFVVVGITLTTDAYSTEKVNGITWYYEVIGGVASLGYQSGSYYYRAIPTTTKGVVTIPATLGGYSVKLIGREAFKNCPSITHVTIPNIVADIGIDSFRSCTNLMSVTIPNSVTNIRHSAFRDCSRLTNVTILDSVMSIGSYAFYGCSGLTSVTIPDSVTSIGSAAFSSCSRLTSVTIPDSVTSIEFATFSDCRGLTSVTIPDSVTDIGSYAFQSCSKLSSVTMPDSITNIGIYAFSDCGVLTEVTIPNGVKNIPNYAFNGCTNLISITIPNGVTNLGDRAFGYCTNLTSVVIPESVKVPSGYWYAFYNCSGLKSVTIPQSVCSNRLYQVFPTYYTNIANVVVSDGVANIGAYAFSNCLSLTSLKIPNSVSSVGTGACYGCSALKDLALPQSVCVSTMSSIFPAGYKSITNVVVNAGVTELSQRCFSGCSGLEAVLLPESMTSIRANAFDNCSSLESVRFLGDAPDTGSSIYYGTPRSLVTYVPRGSVGWQRGVSSDLPETWPLSDSTARAIAYWNGPDESMTTTPVITPSDGSLFEETCEVSISCATEGAAIYYTTNGTTPRMSARFAYTGPFIVGHSVAIKAVAVAEGKEPSEYVTAAITKVYKLTLPLALGTPIGVRADTDENAPWQPVGDTTSPVNGLAARSGDIGAEDATWMEATVNGAGVFSFWWRVSCEDDPDGTSWDRLVCEVDGDEFANVDGVTGWERKEVVFDESKESHTIRWTYVKDDYDDEYVGYEDCAWVAGLSWIPTAAEVPASVTGSRSVTVQKAWSDLYPSFETLYGMDFAEAVKRPTGKLDATGRPMAVWQDYVMGTDPTDPDDFIRAMIAVTNNVPYVSWTPNLNTNGIVQRVYTVMGKTNLTDAAWTCPTNAAHRFFKVKVEMP